MFAPAEGPRGPAYLPDGEQVLRRVRDYIHIGDKNAGLEGHIAAVGDPEKLLLLSSVCQQSRSWNRSSAATSFPASPSNHSMP